MKMSIRFVLVGALALHTSALFAAAFLEEFVGETRWAHLDIAGPAWNDGGPWGHVPSGGTGYAIPTLVEYVAGLASDGADQTED